MNRNGLRWAVGAVVSLLCGTAGLRAATVELASQVAASQISGTGAAARNFTGGVLTLPPLSLSADGRYLLMLSGETNLVAGQRDGNLAIDLFLRDLLTGTTSLVSHALGSPATAGTSSDGAGVDEAVLSGDGRWAAYIGHFNDVAPGQPVPPFSSTGDLLLYDRAADATTLVASSFFARFHSLTISRDGRYLAFMSDAFDLVPGQQGPPQLNVFLYDRVAKSFRLVSHTPAGPVVAGAGESTRPVLSADGHFVAFFSRATDLVPGQPAAENGTFLYDTTTGTVSRIGLGDDFQSLAMSADGRYVAVRTAQSTYLYDAAAHTTTPLATTNFEDPVDPTPAVAITPDGRWLALISKPTSVVPPQPDSSSLQGVYLYDRVARTFTLASRKHGSATLSGSSAASLALSTDGRFVAFLSRDADLVTGQTDTNVTWDLFLFDRKKGTVALVSHAAAGTTAGDGMSYSPVVTPDGSRVLFASVADNLAADVPDHNLGEDVFSYDTASAGLTAVTRHAPGLPSISPEGGTSATTVSGDGRWVVFTSFAPWVIAGQIDAKLTSDVFLHDRATGATVLISHAAGSATRTAQGSSVQTAVSADGRWVLFRSDAPGLVAGPPPATGETRLYLFDRLAGTSVLVARMASSDNDLVTASLTPDGRWVAFVSYATDLVPGQRPQDTGAKVFLWDRVTHATILVSHSTAGPTVTGRANSVQPRISDDGRWVAFVSDAPDLFPGQLAGVSPNLFLWDRTADRTVLVSHAQGSPLTPGSFARTTRFAMSADGQVLAFVSGDGEIEPGVPPGIYLYDRASAALVRIGVGGLPVLSADGRYTAFASNERPGVDTRGKYQVFLYDRTTGTAALVSRSTSGDRGADDDSLAPAIGADGRYVAFYSVAHDLVPEQPAPTGLGPQEPHVFLWDRLAGALTWITAPRPGESLVGWSGFPTVSASGRQVAFPSGADLVPGDLNIDYDAYLFSLDPPPTVTPVPLPPCPLFDLVGLRSNVRRPIKVAGRCGVPATATRALLRVTALQATGMGNLRLYPGDVTATAAGTLRFDRGQTASASFDLPLATNGNGTLAILPFVRGNGTVRVMVEVDGYVP